MPDVFRFSPNPNRAHEIAWHEWGEAALAAAVGNDRPILLNLTAVWCHWCHLMDETTYSDPDIIQLINDEFVAIRVDADRHPHVQDRYIAGGWPTTAFLVPSGEVLWAGTYTEADQLREVARGVLAAWRERRSELEVEIDRRRRALDASRGRSDATGMVRRERADDVLTAVRAAFDSRNGGFGGEPKFPQPEAVELLYANMSADAACGAMADHTLDGMLAGDLWDPVDGGFFRYATRGDWTEPRYEKLLDVNASLLDAYALGAVIRGRDDWRSIAEGTVAWTDRTLSLADGLWGGSQCAGPAYFSAPPDVRASMEAPPVDATVYTSANARWIGALALAGARLGHGAWVERADAALTALLATMSAPDGRLFHYRAPGEAPGLDFLLADLLEALRAALSVGQATGDTAWIAVARRLASTAEAAFWAHDGGFWDRAASDHDVGVLRYRDRPFEQNAAAARALLDLAQVTGERHWRALAERTLAGTGPAAGRYGVAGATFALATEAYFSQPPAVFVALPEGADADDPAASALRRAAFALPVPGLRVWPVAAGHATGPQRFDVTGAAAAWIWTRHGCSGPAKTPDALAGLAPAPA
ncbi:MAG TPA: DUF255 domain-containing protein [Longimicrobiales bacterium]|nr:DUF255 domain-containing protein [Longimicrobiales bacterium]